ncbi:hypothetical protein QVD17_11923 [Tagetes erecta]|uniref:Uncharacterized protein n=1 Tax=Tagetes erecta TaxID=13708 RepID=A0AAD8P2M0_TARER|nr:hypothetical protein QVD17_11923 [Tagetes erecta]
MSEDGYLFVGTGFFAKSLFSNTKSTQSASKSQSTQSHSTQSVKSTKNQSKNPTQNSVTQSTQLASKSQSTQSHSTQSVKSTKNQSKNPTQNSVNSCKVNDSLKFVKRTGLEGIKSEEVAIMAQSEHQKVEPSSSDSVKPLNYVPLPETVKEKLCSPECAVHIEHYITYSFKICEKLEKEEKKHNKLKDDHKVSTKKDLVHSRVLEEIN